MTRVEYLRLPAPIKEQLILEALASIYMSEPFESYERLGKRLQQLGYGKFSAEQVEQLLRKARGG